MNRSYEIQKFIEKETEKAEEAEKKGKSKKITKVAELPEGDGPAVPKPEEFLQFLTKEATKSLTSALVEFYGCSRCRFSRSGCINYFCNPTKLHEHMKKLPHKYEGKKIKPGAWRETTLEEARGEL